MKYKIEKEEELLSFLFKNINKSKNTVKNILKNSCYINGKKISKYDYKLKINDIVEIRKNVDELEIIYEDKNIVVVNKKSGIPTIKDNNSNNNLYHMVSEYLKKQNKNNKVFIIHRLDRDTSGIVMFAKNKNVQNKYQKNWNDLVKVRKYHAIVSNLKNKKGILKDYLKENKEGYVYVSNSGKLAITEYEEIKHKNDYSLLKINIKTGRKNQIRVSLANIDSPILGDKKYGSNENPLKRLCLQANKLEIINPYTNKKMIFSVNIEEEFLKLF